jgi:hypothetical protein
VYISVEKIPESGLQRGRIMGQHGKSLPSFDAPETLKGRKIEWEYENLTHGNKAYNGYVTAILN